MKIISSVLALLLFAVSSPWQLVGQELIVNVKQYGVEDGLSHPNVLCVHHDLEGYIWFGTYYGLNRFDGHDFNIFSKEKNGFPFQNINKIYQVDKNWLGIVSIFKSAELDIKPSLAFINTVTESVYLEEDEFEDGRIRQLFAEAQQGLDSFRAPIQPRPTFQSQMDSIPGTSAIGIKQSIDAQDFYWHFTKNNITILSLASEVAYDFHDKFPEFAESTILCFTLDDAGNAWLGTRNGVFVASVKINPFKQLLHYQAGSRPDHLRNMCFGLELWDSLLYVNLHKSATVQMDIGTGKSTPLTAFLPDNPNRKATFVHQEDMLRLGNSLLLLASDKLTVVTPETEKAFVLTENDSDSLFLQSMFKDHEDLIWVGGQHGQLFTWRKGQTHLHAFNSFTGTQLDENVQIEGFFEASPGILLLATTKGIYQLMVQNRELVRFWTGGGEHFYFPYDRCLSISQDKSGIYWVATRGGGLIRWERSTDLKHTLSLQQFNMETGLPSNTIYAAYEDVRNHLWLPSDFGLIRFHRMTYKTTSYHMSDGITHFEFNRFSQVKAPDGTFFYGGNNGITVFHPDDLLEKKNPKGQLVITDFWQYSSSVEYLVNRTDEIKQHAAIVLQPDDRFFTLNFSLLGYAGTHKVNYEWKVDGQPQGWNLMPSNALSLSGLEHGKQVLRVRAKPAHESESRHEIAIQVTVLQHFYETIWFFLLCLGAGGMLIAVAIHQRVRYLRQQKDWLEKEVEIRTNKIRQQALELEKQADELHELDKAKSRFFANISHELRTPLTLIKGPIKSLLKSKQLDQKNSAFAALANDNANKLLQLVNELLNLTKLESGKLELKETAVVLYPLMQRIVASFESYSQREGIQFILQYAPDQYLQLLLDVKKMEKIVNNLLANAFKFTPRGGNINVLVEDSGNGILLQVSDNGRGIHPEDLPHVFDRFFQSKRKDAPTEGGTGIGLALCLEYANLMKGSLAVESTLEEGATFTLEIPKKEVMGVVELEAFPAGSPFLSTPKQTELLPIKKTNTGTNPRILVVEDNDSLRNYIQLILSDSYDVYIASNGQQAWELLEEAKINYQLIISDLMMPVMDGFQLLKKVKSSEQYKNLPVIMLTARAAYADKLKALRMGIDDYMFKPFEEEELKARVANLLRNRSERIQWANSNLAHEAKGRDGHTAFDEEWLIKLEDVVAKKSADFQFAVEVLAAEMALSRQHLTRRIKQLTGLNATLYIQEARLNKARNLLEEREIKSVKGVALTVGFQNIKYFSKLFHKRFGKYPSEYLL